MKQNEMNGDRKYVYRALDKQGNSIDCLFRAKRDKAAVSGEDMLRESDGATRSP